MLNRTDPRVDPCGTPVVTDLQASRFVVSCKDIAYRHSVTALVLESSSVSLITIDCKGTLVGQRLVGNNELIIPVTGGLSDSNDLCFRKQMKPLLSKGDLQ